MLKQVPAFVEMPVNQHTSCRSASLRYKSATTLRFALRKSRSLDTKNFNIYKHRPLRNPNTYIRLLYLLPRTCTIMIAGKRTIACQLISYQVDRAPAYIGLSYTWGDASSRRPMAIGRRLFYATEALILALEHLQEENRTLVLWIDSICINQEDETEKNFQVQQMGNIFSGAATVLAWLGPPADESDLALQSLKLLSKYNMDRIKATAEAEILILTSENRLGSPLSHVYPTLYRRGSPLQLSAILDDTLSLFVLKQSSHLQSSESRDFVYSLFGMISDTEQVGLRVDYSKTTEAVYTDFAEAILRVRGIQKLASLWNPSRKYAELPSWVPDWSDMFPWISPTLSLLPRITEPFAQITSADGGHRLLQITGHRIDQLCEIQFIFKETDSGDSYPAALSSSPQRSQEYWSFLEKLETAILSGSIATDDKEVNEVVYKMSTSMTLAQYYKGVPDSQMRYDSYCAFRGLQKPPENIDNIESWRQNASAIYLRFIQTSPAKLMFKTSKGYIGLCCGEVLLGDWICVFQGVSRCWIIRETHQGWYRLITYANAYGIDSLFDADTLTEQLVIC